MSSNPDSSNFDYKDYSLEKLQEWVHDAMNGDASPHEIYSAIREAVREEYYYHKDRISRATGLLELLSGHRPVANTDLFEAAVAEREYYEGPKDDGMRPWGHSDWEYQIADNKESLSCDKDDKSPECQKAWNDFWEENYYPEEYQYTATGEKWPSTSVKFDDNMNCHAPSAIQYTEEELNAMCDKAASDEEKQKCQEYNIREAEYYNKKAELDAEIEAIRKEGGYEWTPEPAKKKWVLPVELVKDEDTDEDVYCVSFPDDLLEAAKLKEGDLVEWVDQGDGSYLIKKVGKRTLNYKEAIEAGWEMTADGFWLPPQKS